MYTNYNILQCNKTNIYAMFCIQHSVHRFNTTVDYCDQENIIVAFVVLRILVIKQIFSLNNLIKIFTCS